MIFKGNGGKCGSTGLQGNPKGFTLLEMVVTLGLLSLLLGSIYSFVDFSGMLAGKAFTRMDVHEELRIAANRISRDIAQAVALEPKGEFTDSNWIILQRPIYPGNQGKGEGKKVKYYMDYQQKEIQYAVNNGHGFYGNNPIVNHMADMRFSRQGNIVTIRIVGEKDNAYMKKYGKQNSYQSMLMTKVTPKLYQELPYETFCEK